MFRYRIEYEQARSRWQQSGQSNSLPATKAADVAPTRHTPGLSINLLLGKASAAVKRGEDDQAVGYLEQALAQDGTNADAYHQLAALHSKHKRYTEALEALSRAHALRPDDLQLHIQYGQ